LNCSVDIAACSTAHTFLRAVFILLDCRILYWRVRRQGFWDQRLPKLRESLAHLVGLIMRRAGGDASVAFRGSFV